MTNIFIGETDARGYTLVLALKPVCVLWRGDSYALESGENLIENLTLERAIELFNSVCNTNYEWHFFANEWMSFLVCYNKV